MIIIFISVFITLGAALFSYANNTRFVIQRGYLTEKARNIAEAGVIKAVWCLNNASACAAPYNGETTQFSGGSFSVALTSEGANYKVVSTGTYLGAEKVVEEYITQKAVSSDAAFFYGVQVGAGGLTMGNNSFVDGNIYSNGSIDAGNGAYVTGDVYVASGTQASPDQQQDQLGSEFSFGNQSITEDIAQSFTAGVSEPINLVSLYLKKNGSPSNATVYLAEDDNGSPSTTPLTSGGLVATQVTEEFAWTDIAFETNPTLTSGTTYWIVIDIPTPSSSNHYISGKNDNQGYGNGVGKYSSDYESGSWTSANGDFMFKTWMGGVETHIDGLRIGYTTHTCTDEHYATHHGDAHAHQVLDSTVECDAFYSTDPTDIAGSTVGRNKVPDSEDPAPKLLPVSNGQVAEWKSLATDGGVTNGDYQLTIGQTDELGPQEITGNMLIDNGSTLRLTGTVWVHGDVTFTNNAIIALDPAYGLDSGVLVADGKIVVNNNVVFQGTGQEGSYIMVMSTNTSVDPLSPAITIDNNADTVIFYAHKGMIDVANNAILREATAYKLHLSNGASVSYESGLASAAFANGPGGVWRVSNTNWLER